jgi:hypothetical protein
MNRSVYFAVFVLTKYFSILCGIALLAAGASRMRAADDPAEKRPSREEAEKRKENWKKLSPEEREAKRKEIKARLEKRITDLRAKQMDGTITTPETRELARSEQILKRFEQNAAAAKAERSKSNEPAAPAPPEK